MMQNLVPLHEPIKLTFSWLILIDEIWDSKYSEAIEHVCWGDSLCPDQQRTGGHKRWGEHTTLHWALTAIWTFTLPPLQGFMQVSGKMALEQIMCNSVKKKMLLFALESRSSPKCPAKILLAFSKTRPSSSLTSWYRQATGMQGRLNASIARVPSALRVH